MRVGWLRGDDLFTAALEASDGAYDALVARLRAEPSRRALRRASRLVRSRDPARRRLAIDVLAGYATGPGPIGREARARLLETDDDDPRVIERLAAALAGVSSAAAVSRLVALTGHRDREVRERATEALAKSDADSEQVRDALARALEDEHAKARQEAIRGLALRGDERAIEPLRGLAAITESDTGPAYFVEECLAALRAGRPDDPRLEAIEFSVSPTHGEGRGPLTAALARIADSGWFQGFIFAVIVANAIVLGIQTYELSGAANRALETLNNAFLGIFVVELAIRIGSYAPRPWRFFGGGWNVFDFVVVTAAFAPGLRENATLLRLVRLLRVVRLASVLPDLRILIAALARSLAPIGSLILLTVLLMYVYGMVGWIIFNEEDPERWGTIADAMLNLFIVSTLEEWPTLLREGMEIHPWSWVFFISYVLVASFLVINVLIAIIINSMEEVREADRQRTGLHEARRSAHPGSPAAAELEPGERLRRLRGELDALERELAGGSR